MRKFTPPLKRLAALALLATPRSAVATESLAAPASTGPEAPFRLPPRRAPVDTAPPETAPPDFARRRLEAGLQAGVAHKLCASLATRCSNTAGPAASLSLSSRPSPHFSWGLGVTWTRFGEQQAFGSERFALRESGLSAQLLGRVWPFATGAFDPGLELAAGAGRFVTIGTWSTGSESDGSGSNGNDDALRIQDERITPVLSASFIAGWHVDSHLELGARFTWTHWLLAPWERCTDVAFGACTLPSAGHFDVDDALWTWQLGATFLFGGQH